MLGFVLTGCMSFSKTMPVPLSERHQPSGLNGHFKADRFSSFEDYEKSTREMMIHARTDMGRADRERIIEGNAPFDLKPAGSCIQESKRPYRRGILLTHGLTDSTYSIRTLGKFFQENCFRVMAILLPGHGTRPGDLLDVTWQDWVEAERFGINALASEVDEIYLLGFSTGGTLSAYEALHDPRIKGLFLFSPAIRISVFAAIANFPKLINWAVPRAKWSNVMNDEDPFRYESFTFNAIDQVYLLIQALKAELSRQMVTVPVFMAVSEEDATVSTPESLKFFRQQVTHSLSRMIFYSATTPLPDLRDRRIEVVNSAFPDQHIIGSAHTAMTLPPDDPHFGKEGDGTRCMHYFNKDPKKYALCKEKKEDFLGEISDENMEKGVIRRLMYNPNYDALKLSLKQFINALP